MSTDEQIREVLAEHASLRVDLAAIGVHDSLYSLVQRMTFGATPEEFSLARLMGAPGYIEYHLDYKAIDDGPVEATLAGAAYATLYLKPYAYVGQAATGLRRAA